MTADEIKIVVKAEVDAAVTKLKQLEDGMGKNQVSAKNLGKEFASGLVPGLMAFAGPLGAATLAATAVKQLAQYTKECLNEFEAGDAITKKLEAIVRATGGSAGFTATQMESMAEAFSRATGVEDDEIKNLQAVLATFRSIQGDTFQRATSDALDLSRAFGQDLQSSAIQLGKALEEPITGLTALRRIGVSYTEQEKELIKTMVEHNDVAGAQLVILDGLEKQTKGVAEAMNKDALGAHRNAINAEKELKEERGKHVAEAMKPYWEWLTKIRISALDNMRAEDNLSLAMKAGNANYDEAIRLLQEQKEKAAESAAASRVNIETINAGYDDMITKMLQYKAAYDIAHGGTSDVGAGDAWRREFARTQAILDNIEKERQARKKQNDLVSESTLQFGTQLPLALDKVVHAYDGFLDAVGLANLALMQTDETISTSSPGWDAFSAYLQDAWDKEDALEEKTKFLREAISTGLVDSFSAFGQALAEGGDPAKAFFKMIIDSVGNAVLAFAALTEAQGWATLPISWAKIGAGIALATLGGSIKGIAAAMAEGGSGTVTKPTLFLAGEGGQPEDFSFTPASKRGQNGNGMTQIFNIGGSVISERQLTGLSNRGMARAMRGY